MWYDTMCVYEQERRIMSVCDPGGTSQSKSISVRVTVIVFFQAEDGIRVRVRSRGLGDVYKRQVLHSARAQSVERRPDPPVRLPVSLFDRVSLRKYICLLYTSDAADERSSVDLGGRRIIKKKTYIQLRCRSTTLCNNMHIAVSPTSSENTHLYKNRSKRA